MPTRVKPGGWGLFEKLTSPQITQLDAHAGNAIDRLDAGVERIRRVPDLAALKAIPPAALTANDACYVDQVGLYLFDPVASGTESVPALVAPSSAPALGRWRWDSVRAGSARIPAESVQRGIVFANSSFNITPIAFQGPTPIDVRLSSIIPDGSFLKSGDIISSTISLELAGYSSASDIEYGTNPRKDWENKSRAVTIRQTYLSAGLSPGDRTFWVGSPGAHSFTASLVVPSDLVVQLEWFAEWRPDPMAFSTVGIRDIRIYTTVIRP